MSEPILYRKRIIPEECILLKDDKILFQGKEIIVTGWNSLKPKRELHHGYSCYYLNEGFKVSKFLRHDDSLMFWYCDIVEYEYFQETNTYIVTDLLADVEVSPDGFVKVVDLDELAEALENRLISEETLKKALLQLNNLLKIIYVGDFGRLQAPIEQAIANTL